MSTPNGIAERLARLQTRDDAAFDPPRDVLEERGGPSPRVGEVFAFPETADFAVTWVVIDGGGSERFLVVPADLEPFVGSADVEAREAHAWTLRCRFGLWLEATDFETAKCTAVLGRDIVEQARRKWSEAEKHGEAVGSIQEREVDEETRYQDRLEELAQAHSVLAQRRRFPRAEALESSAVIERPPAVQRRPLGYVYALAASLLVAAVLGVVAFRQQQVIGGLERDEEKTLTNLSYTVFPSGGERGERTVTFTSEASFSLLILPVSEDYPLYQLEIRNREADTLVRAYELTKSDRDELTVLLRRLLFPDGKYLLRLAGLREGRSELLHRYRFDVKSR